MFTALFRACRVALHLCYGMGLAMLFPRLTRASQQRTLQRWSLALLTILNIERVITGTPSLSRAALTVSNHISWLDIFVLNTLRPARFIAKSEVRSWPIIGWLCQRTGTVFIERTARRNTALLNRRLSTLFQQGEHIGLFPEGTTSDGRQVGHFHSALLQSAIDAEVQVRPIALRYLDTAGELNTAVAFIGEAALLQSIWEVLRHPKITVQINVLPALDSATHNRRVLASTAQQSIAQALANAPTLPPPSNGLAMLPHALLSAQSAYVLLLDPILNPPPH